MTAEGRSLMGSPGKPRLAVFTLGGTIAMQSGSPRPTSSGHAKARQPDDPAWSKSILGNVETLACGTAVRDGPRQLAAPAEHRHPPHVREQGHPPGWDWARPRHQAHSAELPCDEFR